MGFPHEHHYLLEDQRILSNFKKSSWVLALTAVMMLVEIVAGFFTHSMALLADGWHMASHAAAMLISLIAYQMGQSAQVNSKLSFGAGKLIPLGGYTSAIILAMISVLMAQESIFRFFTPEQIHFDQAIGVAALGLMVNLASAWILEADDDHHDHNLRSAYVHVLADALTSILAIVALSVGKFYGWVWMDPLVGIVGSLVILKWAARLCLDTGSELLDVHSTQAPPDELKSLLLSNGVEVLDLHTWRIAPNAIACELVVTSSALRGSDYYRDLIGKHFVFQHLVIEERLLR